MYNKTLNDFAFLFDIDGTLLTTDGTGRKAMNMSLLSQFSIPNALDNISLAGATDLGIFTKALQKNSKFKSNKKLSDLYQEWQFQYAKDLFQLFSSKEAYAKSCEGIVDFLQILKQNNIKPGILTGNTSLGAYLKIKFAGLSSYFYNENKIKIKTNNNDWLETKNQVLNANYLSVYGDVSENRNDLPKSLIRSGLKKTMIIFGDTVKDIECALLNSQISVAVKTGFGDVEEMKKRKPHILTDNLNQNVFDELKKLILIDKAKKN